MMRWGRPLRRKRRIRARAHPGWFVLTDDDRRVPPEEARLVYEKAGEPKRLVILKGCDHYELYSEPAFGEVMREPAAWFEENPPPT